MKKLLLIFLIILAGCSYTGKKNITSKKFPSQTIDTKQNKVIVALLLPFNKQYKSYSDNILNAVELFYSSFPNNNLIIKIYNTDDNGKNIAKNAAKQAIYGGANIILGPLLSSELSEVIQVTEPKKIPVLSFSNDRTTIIDTNNTYLIGYSPEEEIERIVNYVAKNKNASKFAALIPENKFGALILADLKASLDIRKLSLVKIITYPENTINFTPYIQNLIDPVDLLQYQKDLEEYNKATDEKYSSLSKNTTTRPFPKLTFDTLFIGDSGKRLTLIGVHLPYLDIDTSKINLIGISQWNTISNYSYNKNVLVGGLFPDIPDIKNTIFTSKYENIFNISPSYLAVAAYNALQMIEDLITIDPDTSNIKYDFSKKALTNYKGFGIIGNFELRNDGLTIRDLIIKQITQDNSTLILDQTHNINYMQVENYQKIPLSDLPNN